MRSLTTPVHTISDSGLKCIRAEPSRDVTHRILGRQRTKVRGEDFEQRLAAPVALGVQREVPDVRYDGNKS